MKVAFTILFLVPFISNAFTRPYDVNKFWGEDNKMHYVIADSVFEGGIRYSEYIQDYNDYKKFRYWTNYTWNNTNGNISVDNTNYPSLNQGDTVFVPVKVNGYRSFSILNVGSVSWGYYAVIYWMPGAYITPSTSIRNANILDNCNWIKVYGWVDDDQIDAAWYQYQNTNYSHRIYFQNCSFRGMNGFFGSFDQNSATLANYTGGNDTTNCFYYWTWDNCRFDSLIGGNSGNTALWIGAIQKNQTWVHAEIMNCYFGHYSSAANPAGYIHAQNVWGLYVHHNQFEQLGKLGPVFVGHAAQIFLAACYTEIHHNKFFGQNLGNCIRNFGGLGHVYNMTLPTTMGWSVNYNGRSRGWDNIDTGSLKYPFSEQNYNTANATTLGNIYQPRTGMELWFNTIKSCYLDATADAYNNAHNDCYENDSVFVKASLSTGPIDTNWTACGIGTHGLGCNKFINAGNGPITIWDTAYNSFQEFAATTGIDSITLKPKLGGFVTNRVTSYPSYVVDDFNGIARGVPTSAGALIQDVFPLTLPTGVKIKYQ